MLSGFVKCYEKFIDVEGVSTRAEARYAQICAEDFSFECSQIDTRELERALGFRLNYRISLHVFTRGSRPAAAALQSCTCVFARSYHQERK